MRKAAILFTSVMLATTTWTSAAMAQASKADSAVVANSTVTTNSAVNASAKIQSEITSIYQAAHHGRVPGLRYVSGKTNIGTIQQAWGKPDSENAAGAGIYDTFSRHHAAFGFNKGGQLIDVRWYGSNLHDITEKTVERTLGIPGAIHHYSGEPILLYPAGPDYQLLWVFSAPTKKSPVPHLDHISVFYPEATLDLMAENGPAPIFTMDMKPGSGGHLFTFSISKPQKGYSVTEFEWISPHGRTVVNTTDEAFKNGATGRIPGFEISGDGQTLSFDYTRRMVGQTGKVRIIEQDSNGTAMMAESAAIQLK